MRVYLIPFRLVLLLSDQIISSATLKIGMRSCDLTFLFLNNGTSLEIVLSFMIDASLSDFMF